MRMPEPVDPETWPKPIRPVVKMRRPTAEESAVGWIVMGCWLAGGGGELSVLGAESERG